MGKKNRKAGRPVIPTPTSYKSNNPNSGEHKPNFYRTKSNKKKEPKPENSYFQQFMNHYSWKLALLLLLCIITLKISSTSSLINGTLQSTTTVPSQNTDLPGQQQEETVDQTASDTFVQNEFKKEINLAPTIFVGILVRNKAHSLPYLLRGLEIQNYPKNRIQIRFIVDNCIDNSLAILQSWSNQVNDLYHSISIKSDQVQLQDNGAGMWTEEHYEHVIKLRQELLNAARKSWADFYLSLDADAILMNANTLTHLVQTSMIRTTEGHHPNHQPIVLSPLMNCTTSEYYSNFWGGMTEAGYYLRSEHYFDLLHRHQQGISPVAMVHTIFLVNLNYAGSEYLNYDPVPDSYNGPRDDLIIFARSAQTAGIQFYLDNTEFFGYIPAPVEEDDLFGQGTRTEQWLAREQEIFVHLRLQAMIDQEDRERVLASPYLLQLATNQLPKPSKLGFDEVYFINLLRRPDRRRKMEYTFEQLGIDAKHVAAVDGKQLGLDELQSLGIKQLEGYFDPYHKRSLKMGEIGCFLSHYKLWEEMVHNGYERILILEDDLRFEPGFVRSLNDTVREADVYKPDWDLLYIGRKRMSKNERRVENTKNLAYPDYTYWTLGYALKLSGAKKLLDQKPLGKMVAVDEYLPIMFDRHPRKEWLEKFYPRNLVALSAEHLLLEPQRYTGEKFYVSDTEDSEIIKF